MLCVAMLCCGLLVIPLSATEHVLVVLGLFIFFLVWDFLMVQFLKGQADTKFDVCEVKIGSRLINIPTVGALVLLLALMHWHEGLESHLFLEVAQAMFAWTGPNGPDVLHGAAEAEAELFVSGLIAFHLFVAAVGYMFAQKLEVLMESGGSSSGTP